MLDSENSICYSLSRFINARGVEKVVKGLFIMEEKFVDLVYPPIVKDQIEALADIYAPTLSAKGLIQNRSILEEAEVIFSGWGGPTLNEELLQAAPNLKAMFYAAGTIKLIMTEAAWKRDILITTANAANAVPVAEYTLSQTLSALKGGWHFTRNVRSNKKYPERPLAHMAGAFGSTVGLISLSTVGRKVNELLQHFDVHVIAYDPFVSKEEAESLNVTLCSLDAIFESAEVVSLHAPLLESTTGMVTGKHLASMKPYASFINTARGAIIEEPEMIDVLKQREDITAILDVTNPEPPIPDSPLYTLPNVILTPDIVGSESAECGRMGAYMLDEFKRYLNEDPLKWQVSKEKFGVMA